MSPEDAEEFTQTVEAIGGGWWRQIAWADSQGIPQALGLTATEWGHRVFGAMPRLSIAERRGAVAELVAEGRTQREIADVLGVSAATVNRDVPNETRNGDDQAQHAESVQNETPPVEWDQPSLDDAVALLEQAATVAELVDTIKTERRPKRPTAGVADHPTAAYLWAHLADVRDLDSKTAAPEQAPSLAEALDLWTEQITRLREELP